MEIGIGMIGGLIAGAVIAYFVVSAFLKKQQHLTTTGNDCSVFFNELERESNIYEGSKPSEHLKPLFSKNVLITIIYS